MNTTKLIFICCFIGLFSVFLSPLAAGFTLGEFGLLAYALLTILPLSCGLLTFFAVRPSLRDCRALWLVSMLYAVGMYFLMFGCYIVVSPVILISIDGISVEPPALDETIYLWQRPWLIHRVCIMFFQDCQAFINNESRPDDILMSFAAVILSISLPAMALVSLYHLWRSSRHKIRRSQS